MNTLFEKLNPRSGTIQTNVPQDEAHAYFDIRWKGDFHFIVKVWTHYSFYYVQRDNQAISPLYRFFTNDDKVVVSMQHLIDEIESGKYKNKQTGKEKIKAIVEQRWLGSFMNNTKWKELVNAISNEVEEIPIQYKTLLEDEEPNVFWTLNGDEHVLYMDMAAIEWFKIGSEIRKVEHRGRLIDDVVSVTDKKQVVENILSRFNIPYQYDDTDKCFTVFGYR